MFRHGVIVGRHALSVNVRKRIRFLRSIGQLFSMTSITTNRLGRAPDRRVARCDGSAPGNRGENLTRIFDAGLLGWRTPGLLSILSGGAADGMRNNGASYRTRTPAGLDQTAPVCARSAYFVDQRQMRCKIVQPISVSDMRWTERNP
jgi:hypothetical protein